jgi:threonine dehydratase
MKAGKPVLVPTSVTLADGLAVPEMGPNSYNIISRLVDQVITIPEKSISVAILHLLEKEKMLLEGAGATGLAGFVSGKLDFLKGMKTAVVLCGGNIDITALGRVIERGLYSGGRLLQFDCAILDRPGGLAKFARLLAETGVAVKEIVQERPYVSDIHICSVHVTVEARDRAHLDHMVKFMQDHNYSILKVDDGKWDHVKVSKL